MLPGESFLLYSISPTRITNIGRKFVYIGRAMFFYSSETHFWQFSSKSNWKAWNRRKLDVVFHPFVRDTIPEYHFCCWKLLIRWVLLRIFRLQLFFNRNASDCWHLFCHFELVSYEIWILQIVCQRNINIEHHVMRILYGNVKRFSRKSVEHAFMCVCVCLNVRAWIGFDFLLSAKINTKVEPPIIVSIAFPSSFYLFIWLKRNAIVSSSHANSNFRCIHQKFIKNMLKHSERGQTFCW